jgi:site-specific DNA-methyltransferase (adenine-specific)
MNYNPDVLECLANLSNDEVFTPPKVVNNMLDLLPKSIWKDKNATFLDPVCKSGVFLREIAKRLLMGLEEEIPDLQKRINHIFKNQLYGIAITELTSLLSRRSVYCSKVANGKYSVANSLPTPDGNILYDRTEHKWKNGKCEQCGASKEVYDREDDYETHAYQFIHTDKPERIFNMRFDVIVGNPPYQLSDGGFGKSAQPIYQLFVQRSKKLNPRYLTMIIPSRWFGGGKGLNEFREEMLKDDRLRKIIDFENAVDCFPGVDIAGGVCYFLWDRDNQGKCEVININNGQRTSSIRVLDEFKTFIRQTQAIPIIRQVLSNSKEFMNISVSSRKPFGLSTSERPQKDGDLILRWQKGEGPYPSNQIRVGRELINKWKVITSYVGYDHAGTPGKDGKRKVFSKIGILPPGTICNETYLVIGSYDTLKEAKNLRSYMTTKFFRFLVSQFMYSHHITRDSYSFVPILNMKNHWADELLYRKYNLNQSEIEFIESMIRPME